MKKENIVSNMYFEAHLVCEIYLALYDIIKGSLQLLHIYITYELCMSHIEGEFIFVIIIIYESCMSQTKRELKCQNISGVYQN